MHSDNIQKRMLIDCVHMHAVNLANLLHLKNSVVVAKCMETKYCAHGYDYSYKL